MFIQVKTFAWFRFTARPSCESGFNDGDHLSDDENEDQVANPLIDFLKTVLELYRAWKIKMIKNYEKKNNCTIVHLN